MDDWIVNWNSDMMLFDSECGKYGEPVCVCVGFFPDYVENDVNFKTRANCQRLMT